MNNQFKFKSDFLNGLAAKAREHSESVCRECHGEGSIRFKMFDTGEYAEWETVECDACLKREEDFAKDQRLNHDIDELKGNPQ
jgi:hypothetical protein